MASALDRLCRIRMHGLKPERVWLWLGGMEQPEWWEREEAEIEISLPDDSPTLREDLRPLVGCDVTLIAEQPSEVLRAVTAKLQGIASSLTVVVQSALPNCVGHAWEKGAGWREIGVSREVVHG